MRLLPDAESFRRLVDGSLTGVGPALARGVLAGVAIPYGAVVGLRNRAYDSRLLRIRRADVPVVSVGNLTLGGTGKTPLVSWIARAYRGRSRRVAIVSRGYGALPGERSDEAAELAVVLPDVPHVADRDRVAAVARAVAGGAEVAILDDGFQHRRLARTVDIVAVDATDPDGCGHLFPRGLLREPVAALRRADAVVLTRASAVSPERRGEIHAAVARASGARPLVWLETDHEPVGLRGLDGALRPLEWLVGRRVAAFAGIGNPAPFRAMLVGRGAAPLGFRAFPDHHRYDASDQHWLGAWGAGLGAEVLVTTLKDLVKLRPEAFTLPVVAVEIALAPLGDAGPFQRLLDDVWRRDGVES